MPLLPVYQYRCRLHRVIDGDTVELIIDLGFRTYVEVTVRLHGVDTPEVRGDDRLRGLAAKAFVGDWFTNAGSEFVCRTYRDRTEKYGRWLADIHTAGGRSLVQDLRSAGHTKHPEP